MAPNSKKKKSELKQYHSGNVEMFHARLLAQVPTSSVARVPGGITRQKRKGRSVRSGRRERSQRRSQFSTQCGGKSNDAWKGSSTLLHRTLGKTMCRPRCSKPGMADIPILQLSGCRPFVLGGLKRFFGQNSRLDRVEGRKRDRYSRAVSGQRKTRTK